jgi:hypothetical protein
MRNVKLSGHDIFHKTKRTPWKTEIQALSFAVSFGIDQVISILYLPRVYGAYLGNETREVHNRGLSDS